MTFLLCNFKISKPNQSVIDYSAVINSLRPSDAYMRHWTNHHWFRTKYGHACMDGSSDIIYTHTRLTHWGRVTHICVVKLTIIDSDNGSSPGRCQAIIWTNAGILFIGPLRTNFSEILAEIYTFSFKKMHLKMSGEWQPFCQPHCVNNTLSRIVLQLQNCESKP